MRRAATEALLSLSLTQNLLSQFKSATPVKSLPVLLLSRPLSTKSIPTSNTREKRDQVQNNKRDSLILEKFRQRKLQGSSKTAATDQRAPPSSGGGDGAEEGSNSGVGSEKTGDQTSGPTNVVCSFEELGLKQEITEAAGEMGVWVPSEIQCVGIPAVLEGKSVVLSSDSGSGRTLAYLLPLLQLLRDDRESSSTKSKHPRAIVLCTTEEQSDQGFCIAKFINDFAQLKLAKDNGPGHSHSKELSDSPIGMLIGTPSEILQQMEDGSFLTDNIKYLVLDEADAMFDHGLAHEIYKIVNRLKDGKQSNDQTVQTVLVTSAVKKMLGKLHTSFMERLEHDNAGQVGAMLLEMNPSEIFNIIESPDALKQKIAQAMDSLT